MKIVQEDLNLKSCFRNEMCCFAVFFSPFTQPSSAASTQVTPRSSIHFTDFAKIVSCWMHLDEHSGRFKSAGAKSDLLDILSAACPSLTHSLKRNTMVPLISNRIFASSFVWTICVEHLWLPGSAALCFKVPWQSSLSAFWSSV